MRLVPTILAFSLALAAPSFAQTADPSWLEDLSSQIESKEQCKVAYLIRVHEGELGSKKTYEARVQCVDGRMFDAQRIGDVEPFTFKACEIQVC